MPSSPEERVYTTLLLHSIASRPLADDASPDFIQLDRTALWRLAEATGARAHIGRTTFYAVISELADDSSDAVELSTRGGNRTSVALFRYEADPDTWIDDVLAPIGFAGCPAALSAATALGIDTTSPLPLDALLPFPADEDDLDDGDDLTEKTCTRCQVERPADEFPERSTGRLSSWCRPCSVEATRDSRARRRPNPAAQLPRPEILQVAATTLHNGSKVCPGCRTRKPLAYFHRDASRGDDHAVRCRACRSDGAHDAALRRFTDL